MKLVIANKAYSSWSMRPWLALKHLHIPFAERLIPLRGPEWAPSIAAQGAGSTVPILHDGEVTVWESLAILDYLDATHAAGRLWPKDRAAMGLARAMATEMHGGFAALRGHCPMNVRRRLEPYPPTSQAQTDVDRILALWTRARDRFGGGGPFLFGAFSAADAMYAPVVMRLHFYALPVPAPDRAYMDAVLDLAAVREWLAAAAQEPWVIDDLERY